MGKTQQPQNVEHFRARHPRGLDNLPKCYPLSLSTGITFAVMDRTKEGMKMLRNSTYTYRSYEE
jgi:hypothetical protein